MPELERTNFRLFHRLRVRWAEVDMQKIVFNPHYLMYFDVAITDYWRALALPYPAALHRLGGDLYVVKATVEFHGSARGDDQIEVALKCSRIGRSSMTFTGAIFRAHEHLISAEIVYVFADPVTQTSRPVPQALRDAVLGYEAGEAMVHVRVGGWSDLGEHAQCIRNEVFVEEQRIPRDLVCDAADLTALHAVAYNRLGLPIATGRLIPHAPGVVQVGRLAVTHVLRGGQLGRQVLRALTDAARARGESEVMLHAQRGAEGFYARLGYQRRGAPFQEAGIAHVEMFTPL